MRHYAPHNAHFQTWASPARPTIHRPSWTTLRDRVSNFLSHFNPGPSPQLQPSTPPPSPNASFSTHPQDDLHIELRLSALHRWLSLTTPLSDVACRALRTLMRDDAIIVRSHDPAQCVVCAKPLHFNAQTRSSRSTPFFAADSIVVQAILFIFSWTFLLFTSVISRFRNFSRFLQRRRLLRQRRTELLRTMHRASCYSAWYNAAATLDHLEAKYAWMTEDRSTVIDNLCNECDSFLNAPGRIRKRTADTHRVLDDVDSVFDVDMLSAKLRELSDLYSRNDVRGLAFALRASLIRNFGGMCHPRLHMHSRVGTDRVVEDYVYVVSFLLAYVSQSDHKVSYKLRAEQSRANPASSKDGAGADKQARASNSMLSSSSDSDFRVDDPMTLSIDDKLTFLNEARHAYGRTALMLSGGAVMGLHHFGIVKSLLSEDLLPRVVCGTSAGALVASIVGILNDDELLTLLTTEDFLNPITNQPFVFRFFQEPCTWHNRFRSFMHSGYLEDVTILQDTLRLNYGDLTFQEAYEKTGRILNITVCPTRSSSDPALLLNYLTAPHVLIWSAASASCAIPLMFQAVELVAKSANGRLVPYHSDGSRWIDGSVSSDVPLARIGELFNVNHFIVSQTNPHVIPRSFPILHTRLAVLIKYELQFRYWQAMQLGLIPRLLSAIFPHFMQPYAGDVTIMPDIRLSDLSMLMRNPTPELLKDFMKRGELQTYPYIDCVRLHCSIERALDKCVEYVATMTKEDEEERSSSVGRGGLFGRVPSWLWLDTRSILSNGSVGAMASRFARVRQAKIKSPRSSKDMVLQAFDRDSNGPKLQSDKMTTDLKRSRAQVETSDNTKELGEKDNNDNQSRDIDALVKALKQDVVKRPLPGSGSNIESSSDNSSTSDSEEADRIIC